MLGAWLAILTFISLAPLGVKVAFQTNGRWHNALHGIVFLATGLLAILPAQTRSSRALRALALLLFCTCLELLQALFYRNPFEWRDVIVDLIALCCAWLAAAVFRRFHPVARGRIARPYRAGVS